MPQVNTKTLQGLVERSRLLTPDRREELLKRLPSLSPAQQEKLQEILDGESDVLAAVADNTLTKAIKNSDAGSLKRLDDFFAGAGKKLRKAEEGINKVEETKELEQLLDDINT